MNGFSGKIRHCQMVIYPRFNNMINAKHKKYDNFLRSALIPCRLFLDSELLTIHDYDGEFSFYVDIINNNPKMNGQEIR